MFSDFTRMSGASRHSDFHRLRSDLKPENLLYMSDQEGTPAYNQIKVADFGLARTKTLDNPMQTMCGTPGEPQITYTPTVKQCALRSSIYVYPSSACPFPDGEKQA